MKVIFLNWTFSSDVTWFKQALKTFLEKTHKRLKSKICLIHLCTDRLKSIYSKAVFYGCQYISKSYWFSNVLSLTRWQLKWQHLASKIAQNWCPAAFACVVVSASVFLWFIVCTWVSLSCLFTFSIWHSIKYRNSQDFWCFGDNSTPQTSSDLIIRFECVITSSTQIL